jgi:hypothetical protein
MMFPTVRDHDVIVDSVIAVLVVSSVAAVLDGAR